MTPLTVLPSHQPIGKQCISRKQIEYSIEDADIAHVRYLAAHLRDADSAELFAASGKSNWKVLQQGLSASDIVKVGLSDNIPFVIWGTVPTEVGAAIWMVGTDGIVQHSREFQRRSKSLRDDLHAAHPLLWNYADVRNTIHHRWLQWLDFKFIRKVNYGYENRPFYEFGRLANV